MKTRTLLAMVILAGCPGPHPVDPVLDAGDAADSSSDPSWQVVLQRLDGTLLSIWGPSPNDVYAVGGPRGNTPYKALVMHFDGTQWKRLDANNTDTYWWVHGSSATDIWLTGENGRITHWDGASFKDYTSGTTATIFGAWAASATDAWAVGGTPEGGTGAANDVLLHWDGTIWSNSPLPRALGRTYFKVWGTGPDNVYAVGEAGTIWHRTQGVWKLESDPPVAHGTLLTVHGCGPNDVYAVGSRDVLRWDGATWRSEPVQLLNDVNGVSCANSGQVAIVGTGGLKQRRVEGTWYDDFGTKPYSDLHGAWIDQAGGIWAVGGSFVAAPQPGVTRDGVIAHYGRVPIPTTIAR